MRKRTTIILHAEVWVVFQTTIILAVLCLGAAVANVIAEWKGGRTYVLLSKIAASTSFLALGLLNFGGSFYGALIVSALAFSWVGDVLLVWRSKGALFGGMAAFLIAHIGYAVAFTQLPLDPSAFIVALFIWNMVVVLVVRWLWQYLAGHDRWAVLIYMGAITVMVSLAGATRLPLIAGAACLFAISDVSVARDRFVERTVANKVWGIPLYYLAQILFASSMMTGQ